MNVAPNDRRSHRQLAPARVHSAIFAGGIALLCVGCLHSINYKGETLPILELNRRYECSLPLTDVSRDSMLAFIAAGGRWQNSNLDETIGDLPEESLLSLFSPAGDSILQVQVFERSAALVKYFPTRNYVEDIVNSCDTEPPPDRTRRAYKYGDFWYVFIAEKTLDTIGGATQPTPDQNKVFSKMIVMRKLAKSGVK